MLTLTSRVRAQRINAALLPALPRQIQCDHAEAHQRHDGVGDPASGEPAIAYPGAVIDDWQLVAASRL